MTEDWPDHRDPEHEIVTYSIGSRIVPKFEYDAWVEAGRPRTCSVCGVKSVPGAACINGCIPHRDPGDETNHKPATILKDSGQREHFPTGSQRDIRTGKGRYDLVPPGPLFRLARIYEDGAIKYDDDNWRKGQNLRRYCESGIRHFQKYLAGEHDEDHLAQASWNAFSAMWTEAAIAAGMLSAELDDMPHEPPPYGNKFKPVTK
jgi:hypothetical protein